MDTLSRVADLRTALSNRRRDRIVGFVPTMGNLHDGHIELIRHCRDRCDIVVASVYVNPKQFGPTEDLAAYPRTPDEDAHKLASAGTDILFMPSDEAMYPNGHDGSTTVTLPTLRAELCGEFRPVHFDGVATVVTKLFNIVQPDLAFFGEKDFQQLVVLKRLVSDLNLPIEVIGVPTVRERDGLAMSSRNRYLSDADRAVAPVLHRTLTDIVYALQAGAKRFDGLEQTAKVALRSAGFEVDYVTIRNADSLEPAVEGDRNLRVLAAGTLGKARLIDNVGVELR